MSTKDEIKNAVAAHGRWKTKLRTAIDTGKIDTPIQTIKADNQCAFGKWLHGPTITERQKNADHYREVKKLHAVFHEKASKVAQLAISGNKTAAGRMLEVNGEFSTASAALSTAMLTWLKKAT